MLKSYLKILILALLFVPINLNAQITIAVQGESGSSFYTSLDTAIVKAHAGDYIYLPGGNFTITQPINKKLLIVGVGHNPDSCYATGITQVTGNFDIKSGSDHGTITGLKINGSITFSLSTGESLNYFSIERCNIGNNISIASNTSKILISECIINGYVSGSSTQQVLLTKCIINSYASLGLNSFITNNIFLGSNNTTASYVSNNIFLSSGITPSESSTTQYQNNSYTTAVSSIYNCHNNIVATADQLFVNKTKTGFAYDQDYHLKTTSPAKGAGTDGTDLGIFGTSSPWKDGSLPSSPHIQKYQSKTVSTLDGKLEVKTKIAAQNN